MATPRRRSPAARSNYPSKRSRLSGSTKRQAEQNLNAGKAWQDNNLVTEEVYRHQLKPVITKWAETMNTIFKQRKSA